MLSPRSVCLSVSVFLPAELGFGRKNLPPVSVVGSEPRPIGIGRSVDFQKSTDRYRFGIGRLKNYNY